MTVLADAEAAETADELIALYSPNVKVDGDSISMSIGTRYRMSFVAIGASLVHDGDAGLDWCVVRRLKMMELVEC